MTPRQQEVLAFVRSYAAQHDGVSPSYKVISHALAMPSRSQVVAIIEALVQDGLLQRRPGKRGLVVVIPALAITAEELMGRIGHALVLEAGPAHCLSSTQMIVIAKVLVGAGL